MESIRVAAVSMNSRPDKEANCRKAEEWIAAAAQAGADWVVLPEMFTYLGDNEQVVHLAEEADGPLNLRLATLAQDLGITLFAGTVAERPPVHFGLSGSSVPKAFNTLYGFDPEGRNFVKYRKLHLFHLSDAEGNALYAESDQFLAGEEPVQVRHHGWNLGMAICYDLRFPELFFQLSRQEPLDALIIPAAFTKATGRQHWELLLRARAVEQQCYVIAANQTGEHGPGKESFGNSMIIDPWGTVLAHTGTAEGLAIAEISRKEIRRYRQLLPALDNRRSDIFS